MSYIPVALRQEVISRANSRCEYCLLLEKYSYYTHEIDHIYAEKHGGISISKNLCLACADCNRRKSSDLCSLDPETASLVALYHPRQDVWKDHFQLLDTGLIASLSAKGRATSRILAFNRPELVFDRVRLIKLGEYELD